MLAADKAKLEELVSEQLSYGHSGGVIETKAQFIEVIVSKKTEHKTIALFRTDARDRRAQCHRAPYLFCRDRKRRQGGLRTGGRSASLAEAGRSPEVARPSDLQTADLEGTDRTQRTA
jgi:meiotically up-regulated gene 157 (Mug157) protein